MTKTGYSFEEVKEKVIKFYKNWNISLCIFVSKMSLKIDTLKGAEIMAVKHFQIRGYPINDGLNVRNLTSYFNHEKIILNKRKFRKGPV